MSLHSAIKRGGVYYDVRGESREQVIQSISTLPGVPSGVDPAQIARLLLNRELLAPTAFEGFAIPHPRNPPSMPVQIPIILLCLLAQPVDFYATDGMPVRGILTLFSPAHIHLRLLSRIACLVRDDCFRQLVWARAEASIVLARIRLVESKVPFDALATE